MCAGDRASYPALAKALADASYPADPDVTDSAQIAPTGHGGPATGQDCMPARLSRLSSNSDGATWDVNGSATAAVLTGNRFAAISPVPPARLAPSPTTLHWPAQSAQVEYASPNQYASAAVPVVQARGVSNNPFRQPDRKSTGGVLEYAYDGIQDASAARSAVPRRASTNPFRTANRPWIAHTVSPPPVPAAQLNMTPPYVSHDLLEPVRPWQPTSIPVNPGYTTGLSADVQQSHVPWVSDSESPTQADMWWPVMSPTSKSREGAMQHTPVGSVEPGPGAVFCHAI
ncbi:hypothetical protein EVJ58_g4506 [Rhodofomes roseus]|nr:hypothetical protein EVJ58_g4506 [Rhodofomes roseus]